jgi:hypothetical protein
MLLQNYNKAKTRNTTINGRGPGAGGGTRYKVRRGGEGLSIGWGRLYCDIHSVRIRTAMPPHTNNPNPGYVVSVQHES